MNHPHGRADVNLFCVVSAYRWQRFVWIVLVAVVVPVFPDFGIHSVVSVRFAFGWPLDSAKALHRMISHDEIDERSLEVREHDPLATVNRLISDRNLMTHARSAFDADRTASF